jgi:hypothetical protein
LVGQAIVETVEKWPQIIEKRPRSNSMWISVRERLPKVHKSMFGASEVVILAHRLRSRPDKLVVKPGVLVQRDDEYIWFPVGNNIPIFEVTHWMPLPEPPVMAENGD